MDKFIELVIAMRDAQKLTEKQPTQTHARRAKNLETQVDVQAAKLKKWHEAAQQPVLFPAQVAE